MTAASFEWLGLAIMMVEYECARSGRSPDRVRRMFANNASQRDKALRRVLAAAQRVREAQKQAEVQRAAEAKRAAIAKAHEEMAAENRTEAAE